MVETLYFKCYYSFLRGNLQDTKMYYELLKEEFKNASRTDLLKDSQLLELKRIKEAIKTGLVARSSWLDDPGLLAPPSQSATIGFKQDELVRKIDHNSGQLKEILQDDIFLYNVEHDCGIYGRCDMIYMSKNTVYPIEIKKDKGDHSLIGQIMKYDLYHRLRLHYKNYDFVQSATICSSYDNFTLKELKKLNIKTLIYSGIEDIKLSEI